MSNAHPDPPESPPDDANRVVGASLIAAGGLVAVVQVHDRYPAEVELAAATGLAVAAVYMLTHVARDRLRGRPGGLLRPGVAVAGLSLAALIIARRGPPWLLAVAVLNLLLAFILVLSVRRPPGPPTDGDSAPAEP